METNLYSHEFFSGRSDSSVLDLLVPQDLIISTRETNDVILPCVGKSLDSPSYM